VAGFDAVRRFCRLLQQFYDLVLARLPARVKQSLSRKPATSHGRASRRRRAGA